MFSVFWSDRNDILIYRTFDDFKNLTRQLEKKFPLEAGLVKRSERILPILKGKRSDNLVHCNPGEINSSP
ncbi:hypothetical protein FKM82_022422 [Ascaphus truei]